MIKVLPIEGPESYWALQSYIKLLIGLKMLPNYMGMDLYEFLEMVELMPVEDRKKIIKEALLVVTLDKDELNALMKFSVDNNNVPYGPHNMKSLKADELMKVLSAVVDEIASIELNFLTDKEKKKSIISQSTSGESSQGIQH